MIPYSTFVHEAYQDVVISERSDEDTATFMKFYLGWTCFFIVFHFFIVFLIKTCSQLFYSVDEKKRQELPGYVVALVHHMRISPICLYCIVSDYMAYNAVGGRPFAQNHYDDLYSPSGLYPFSFAYFTADMIVFAIPEALKKGMGSKLFLAHHLVALSMLFVTYTRSQGVLTQVFAAMMCTESSTILFNLAWILRAFGFRGSTIVSVFEVSFAVVFIILRNVHLSLLTYLLWQEIGVFGIFQLSIVGSTFLQFFWASKIVMHFISPKKKVT